MAIGNLWKFFGNRTGMAILMVQLVLVLLFIYFYSNYQSSDRCVVCHADKERMTKLGYPQFVMTREQVQKEAFSSTGTACWFAPSFHEKLTM